MTGMGNIAQAECYGATTEAERHLRDLLDELPRMQRVQEQLETHREACRIVSKYQCVDDLEGDIEQLEAKDPLRCGIDPGLMSTLLQEKRSALKRERARFNHDLERSPFDSLPHAVRSRLPEQVAMSLEAELNRYREDYAYTLARCQTEAAGAGRVAR